MLTRERKRLILDCLKKDGRIIAKDLSARLKLSEDTIRRDLRELAADGLLMRVHGGALPASPTVANLASRRTMSLAEKTRLARAGAGLLKRGQRVFIDGGTSNLEMVRMLPPDFVATVFTHSPTIAGAMEPFSNIEVVLIGGKLFRHSMVAIGGATIQAIESMRVDMFFLGVTGIHPEGGLTTGDFEEAVVKRAIVSRSAEVVTLSTTDKLGAVSSHCIGDVTALTHLVVTKEAKFPKLPKSVKIIRAS
jgi:DeoR/GlpR family transcriptional regulator of sugar metabolism